MEAEPQLEAGSSDDEGPDGGQWVDAGSRGSPRDDSLVVTWQLHVKSDDGVTTIEIEPDASCVEAKERIARIEGTPAELMRLSLSMPGPGNVPLVELNDMFSLSECGVKDGSVVLLSRKDAASPPPRTATDLLTQTPAANIGQIWLERAVPFVLALQPSIRRHGRKQHT